MALTKVSKRKFNWTAVIVVSVVFTILALYVARATYDNPDCNLVNIWGLALDQAMSDPFDFIYLGSTSWQHAWLVFVALATVILYIYVDYEKDKNSYYGKEKGTAKWIEFNTPDHAKYEKRYAYPKGAKGHQEPPEGSNDLGNLILGEHTYLNLAINQTFKNDNVFVLGLAGSGKSRYYVKPNILQQNTSYIITDPSGELLTDIGMSLQMAGYEIKVFNLNEMDHSCGYNPFNYIRSDSDIPILVDCFVKNTNDDKAGKGDQFFDQAMVQLFTAIFYYIHYREPKENHNMNRVVEMLTMMKVDENNPNAKSKLDLMFDMYEKEDPTATAVTNYKMFRVGAGKTLKSIIISANVRMRPFTLAAVSNLTRKDTIHLEEIGDHKQAIFIITPTQIKTYNFLAAMMYTQLFQIMYNKASNDGKNRFIVKWDASSPIQSRPFNNNREKKEIEAEFASRVEKYKKAKIIEEERKGLSEDDLEKIGKYRYVLKTDDGEVLTYGTEEGKPAIFESKEQAEYFLKCVKFGKIMRGDIRLPSHVHMIFDEFANIGIIPNFQEIIATCRKFSISCTLILQSRAQLKELYKDNADTLIANCASLVFLGTTSLDDAKWISEKLGKATQAVRNQSYSYGPKGSMSQSWNKDGIDLMTPDEVLRKPSEDCIIQIEGLNPFYDKKYNLERHPNYKMHANGDTVDYYPYKVFFNTNPEAKKQKEVMEAGRVQISAPGTKLERDRDRARSEGMPRPGMEEADRPENLMQALLAESLAPGSTSGGMLYRNSKGIPGDKIVRGSMNRRGSTGGSDFSKLSFRDGTGINSGDVMSPDPTFDGFPFG